MFVFNWLRVSNIRIVIIQLTCVGTWECLKEGYPYLTLVFAKTAFCGVSLVLKLSIHGHLACIYFLVHYSNNNQAYAQLLI